MAALLSPVFTGNACADKSKGGMYHETTEESSERLSP